MRGAERILWYLNFAATLLLLARLFTSKLTGTYRWLFLYWSAQVMEDLVLFRIPVQNILYEYCYYATQSINLALAVFVVLDLYRTAFAAHPGLAAFGRRSMLTVLGAASLLAAAGMGVDSTILPGQFPLVHRFLAVMRSAELVILLFLLAMSVFLLWFGVKIRRNVGVYITGFVVFYFSQSFVLLAGNLLPRSFYRTASELSLAGALFSLLIWLIGLRSEDASSAAVIVPRADTASATRLALQLDEINAALARFVRS